MVILITSPLAVAVMYSLLSQFNGWQCVNVFLMEYWLQKIIFQAVKWNGTLQMTLPPWYSQLQLCNTLAKGSDVTIPLSIYYGPSDFRLLKKYDNQMGKLVNLGQGIYAFVRPINKFVVLPVFDFFRRLVGSYGIAILLLTFLIRLIISPLTYTSYLSGAKMKVLRPEIEKLKAKHGGDQQL